MQPGREQLKDWIKRRGFTQREASAYLGIDEAFMTKLLGGDRTPGLGNAVMIERHTGIPIEAWMSSELDASETPTTEPVRKRK